MSKLDVAFVIPSDSPQTYQALEHAIEPPAKARFIAAYLMRRNCSVAVLDAAVLNYSAEKMAEEVLALRPHLVVMTIYGYNPSASTQTMVAARQYAQSIRDHAAIPVLLTGTHPAALPERTLREEPIDYVCDGEGPITVHELLQAIKEGGSVKKVQSLWYWEDGVVAHNVAAPLIDLNAEPALPGWIHMDPRKYYAHDWHTGYADREDRAPYANPFSVEGCPFHCEFCNIQAPFRAGENLLVQTNGGTAPNSYRRLRPELFVAEVACLVEIYGVRHFKIPDEMFALHPGHVLAIAKGITERFGDSLNFWAYARIDTCKPQFLEPMRAAGIRWLAIGIEAANSGVRSGQDKDFTDERIYDVVKRVYAAGIGGALNYIFGLPGDTMESMRATYDLAASLNSVYANLYCTQALPGSILHKRATASEYPLPERPGGAGWIGYGQYSYKSEPYYEGEALTPAEILKFRDEAFMKYYSRPEYRAMLLRDPLCGGAVALRNVERMLARPPLRRKLLEMLP